MAVEEIVLRDEQAGSQARVLAGYGFNCYCFQVQHAGRPTELLWAQPSFALGKQRASASGIPLLFPFAGRIGKAAYIYEGRKYDLEPGDGIGNAIHGFVLGVPWRVTEQTGNKVAGEYHAGRDNPAVLERWPADFRIRVSYELRVDALLSRIAIDNPGDGPLPFWFGTHPYFRVPPLGGDNAAGCIVRVPARNRWPLENMLPTGKTETGGVAAQLSAGMPFADTKLDDVFGDLKFTSGKCRSAIDDPATHRAIEMTFGPEFSACVVYNPPHREAICIEPYTAVPDAFVLESRGIAAGLRVLQPGESFDSQIDIAVVPVK
jgi:aldose 1-epimerase